MEKSEISQQSAMWVLGLEVVGGGERVQNCESEHWFGSCFDRAHLFSPIAFIFPVVKWGKTESSF